MWTKAAPFIYWCYAQMSFDHQCFSVVMNLWFRVGNPIEVGERPHFTGSGNDFICS